MTRDFPHPTVSAAAAAATEATGSADIGTTAYFKDVLLGGFQEILISLTPLIAPFFIVVVALMTCWVCYCWEARLSAAGWMGSAGAVYFYIRTVPETQKPLLYGWVWPNFCLILLQLN